MIQKELYCLLEGMVHDIVHHLQGVRAVILFGSRAKWNPRWDSDIDLLVLVDQFSQVAAARERLERGELRAAATYALNAQRLLENNLNLSSHLENLIGKEIALDAQMVERWVKETEAKVGMFQISEKRC